MTNTALVITLALLVGLAVMQILLSLGLPLGHYAWGGRHRVLPRRLRIASIAAVVIYAVFAALLMSRAGLIPGGGTLFVVVATWVLFAYSVIGIAGNVASRSRQERMVQTPISVVLSIGILIVALGM